MPNITISGLPFATLPLDGPNSFFEVQTIEAGVTVSRKVASDDINLSSAIVIEDEGVPLAGGADTLDFVGAGVTASGAGSTKTITIPGGGQVDSVVSGVNITIDATDPINPIANLDAAITGMTVNGVVLTAGGVATNYLDETGAYSLPPGSGQVDSVGGGVNINVTGTAVDPIVNLDAAITGVSVDGVTLNAVGAATNYLDESGAYSVPAGAGGQVDSVAGGTNINVSGTGVDPIVNLDAAITGVSVNGVTLSNAGAIGDFLNEQGNYVAAGGFDPSANQTITGDWSFEGEVVLNNPADDLELLSNVSLNFRNPADTSTTFLQSQAGRMEWGIAGAGFGSDYYSFGISFASIRFPRPLYFSERAAQITPIAGQGQLWVRNDAPNNLIFTDDDGTDFQLNTGLTPWTSDIDGGGFNLEGAGVVFLVAQPTADPDVTGRGQIWVEGVPGDPLWSEVELLADFDGADGATSYTEISVNTASATFFGTAELDTAEFNSGVSSLLLDGNSDWVTFPDIAAYDLGTQSWTIEGFVRFNTLPPLQTSAGPGFVLYDSRKGGSAYVQYGIIQDAFGFRVRLVGQDWGAEVGTISGGISTGVWYHWAVTRDVGGDNNIRAYFNGLYEVADFGVSPADLGNPDAAIIIGCRDATDAFTDGWIDDVRMTVGTARYAGTGAYSVPTTPYAGAPAPLDLFFTDDDGLDFQLNAGGGGESLQATMAIGATTTIDLEIITGAALTIFDGADVDSVSIEINSTTMAPAEALVFLATANVEVYSFDEGINIDNGDLNLNLGSVNFYRFGDSVSSSLGSDGTDIRMQVVGGTSVFFVQADSIRQSEAAAPAPNIAGRGQWWTRSSAPCRPTYTDDTDVDQLLDPSISEIISVVASRTGILTDKGKTVAFTGGTVAQTMTIPASGAVAYQIGTLLAWDNSGSVSISIAITTDTLIFADDNSTGTRTLAAGGAAVAQLVGAGVWKIAGAGLS